ncbi:MAG TPA: M14 family zinc carboxypeptidase [Vicinamibacterales bacterium]|nr:M14 family zinc carboxypeptidase [Vicinamibacterales bacterium]
MTPRATPSRRPWTLAAGLLLVLFAGTVLPAQTWVTETRDPKQVQDEDFARSYAMWTAEPRYGSPLVDHLPKVNGIPTPKDVLGYYIGAPNKLTYYADIVKYYRALAAATPRVKVETIGRSDEDRELVVVWVSSDANIKNLQTNRDNLAKLADPRGLPDIQIKNLIATTKPHYHLMGGLHSGETGPSEMLMELVYRLATETSPFISQIRDNVYVSVTPVADADGRDRNVDWYYRGQELAQAAAGGGAGAAGGGGRGGGGGALPYWGKYVFHDNNRDINLSQVSMRAITNWYYTAHPPIMHDLHEAQPLMYTYSGGPPQNPNLDPILFSELPFFANWEMAQMTKWGMPGVYTHAFMDGWSPGYLGSVAYNHNGMMKMYETTSGNDNVPNPTGAPTANATTTAGPGGGRGAGGGRGGGGAGGGAAAGQAGAAGAGAAAGQGAAGGGRGAAGAGAGGANAFQGRGGQGAPPAGAPGAGAAPGRGAGGGGRGGNGTGRGGGQDREWYRGIAIPPGAQANFTRRVNTNYMETGVLSSLQLTSMFPNLVVENFYIKTRNSIAQGLNQAPYAYVIPVQRDMTKPAELVRILRLQGIEVGTANADIKIGDATFKAGSYVIRGGQPYWRLAKNLLERQDYPDPDMRTYDDSGWTMGYAFNVDVKEIADKAILDAPITLVKSDALKGRTVGAGTAGVAVAHFGSNNMITFRYRLKATPMKVAEKSFSAEGIDFPAGSFIVTGSAADLQAAKAAADSLGLTAASLASVPAVATHDADAPRVAIYSQWGQTQELGWYRHAFDQFGIPFDLIFKERVARGNLKADYDVIIMAAQSITRAAVMQQPAARPQPYEKSDKYKFLGMYGSTPDMSGGFGQAGVDAFEKFLEGGGTLITTLNAVRFPIEFGWARSIDTESVQGFNAQKPLVQAEIVKTDSPIFYGYPEKIFPVKFGQGQQVFKFGVADQDKVVARFVGGDASVLSGLGEGAAALTGRAFVMDVPEASRGKGRVVMFSSNPIYRWQNHGEFNMVFNAMMNWNDVVK